MTQREHSALVKRVLLASGKHPDVFLHPNPVGRGYTGLAGTRLRQLADRGPDALYRGYAMALNQCRITYGLGPGSPDLVGWVGNGAIGLVLTGEVKTGGAVLSPAQRKWQGAERDRLGAVDVWRSVDDYAESVERLRDVIGGIAP